MAREYLDSAEVSVIIHHAPCLDGLSAAAVCPHNVTYIGFNPNVHKVATHPDINNLPGEQSIVFFDCAPHTVDELLQLRTKHKRVMIVDHHIGSQRIFENVEGCFFRMDKAGCVLAWEYFRDTDEMPEILVHIGDRDLGKFNETNRLIGYALMDMNIRTVASMRSLVFLDSVMASLVTGGQMIVERIERLKRDTPVFFGELSGHRFVYAQLDSYQFVSELAEYLYTKYDVAFTVLYYYENGKWKFSLRTNKDEVDVSLIAKEHFNGNGHKRAAGGALDAIPDFISPCTSGQQAPPVE
jgi:nanoRNase/pAp phosphatase (c-di-AMP/oligoRNAs hydrolase)